MFSFKKTAATVACAALPLGGAVLAAAPAAMAAVPTSFVSLSYGPNHVSGHQLALDVLGQVKAFGQPVVAWQSDEYQGVTGRVDPAEQFITIAVQTAASSGGVLSPLPAGVVAYQIEWAPNGVPSGFCVDDQSAAQHTHAVIEPCASATDAATEVTTTPPGPVWLTGSIYQDFYFQTDHVLNTNQLASYGYGELEPVLGFTQPISTTAPWTGHTALNDSAYVNGGHVISWPAVSSTNEEFKFRPAS